MVSFDDVFSVYALFVLFRESLEASIICAVLLQFLDRVAPREKRQVWYGLAAGLIGAVIFGIIFVVIFYVAKNNIFSGTAKSIFRAVICWSACIIITMLAFAMLRFNGWETKLKRKMEGLVLKAAAKKREALALQSPPAQTFNDTDMLSGSETTKQRDGDRVLSSPPVLGMAAPSGAASDPSLIAGPPRAATTVGVMTLALAPSPGSATVGLESTGLKRRSGGSSSNEAGCSNNSDGGKKGDASFAAPGALDADVEKGALVEADKDGGAAGLLPAPSGVTDLSSFSAADIDMPWRERYGILLVIFITVLREGIESVIFLAGVGNGKPSAIPLAGAVGFILGVGFGVFLYYTGKQVKDLKIFMTVMAIILFFIAAGQAELGTYLLLHAEAFGHLDVWIADRPWWQVPQWNWSGCCSQYNNRFFGLANAIFGYVSMPTALEVIVYFCYWLVVILMAVYKYWRGTLFDADYKYNREMKKKALAEAEAVRLAALKEAEMEDGDSSDCKDVMGLPPPKKMSSDEGDRSSEDASHVAGSSVAPSVAPSGQTEAPKYLY